MSEVDLFNTIYNEENPVDIFADEDSPYHDYHLRLSETKTYCKSIVSVVRNKMNNWSMSMDQEVGNTLMVYYASYFEMFAKDGLVETFYGFFPIYSQAVLSDSSGYLFKDLAGDTFLHYCSRSFNCADALNELHRVALTDNDLIVNPLDMMNLHKVTPRDILMLE